MPGSEKSEVRSPEARRAEDGNSRSQKPEAAAEGRSPEGRSSRRREAQKTRESASPSRTTGPLPRACAHTRTRKRESSPRRLSSAPLPSLSRRKPRKGLYLPRRRVARSYATTLSSEKLQRVYEPFLCVFQAVVGCGLEDSLTSPNKERMHEFKRSRPAGTEREHNK